ncbi:transcriptional regulator, PadR family [Georgenia satyanarayanai]|uniref:Transcriptional regulator, PadR family n=1 Tax=Georgenia satyanarayanai TaxID=860221 RepID=A0A2Y9C2Z7_9MICO|nr:PadR family transcriptional regulator [Georgenia satyanarayanai]PYG02132.1 PadR family transcriptional regulator [Georgenia satyanarayanai]SSA36943.1 transcriptional regulator, PadR family [Georgenia satyanarayanai]
MTDTNEPRWPAPWVRAALPTAVLASLEDGALHGYGIAQRLATQGLGRPRGGSLYPLLSALEADGAVTASWDQGESGPGRRSYALTADGAERLRRERAAWAALVDALSRSHLSEDRHG